MHRAALLFFGILLASGDLGAQAIRRPLSALHQGQLAYSLVHADVFSASMNQASLARANHFAAGIYSERRFMMKGLDLFEICMTVPTSSGNFGLMGRHFGSAEYNESTLGIAYGRKLGGKLDVGLAFDYNMIRIGSYGSARAVNFQAGFIVHVTEKVNAGLHAYNPVGGKFGSTKEEKLASVFSMGIGYDASKMFFIGAVIEKEENQPVNINAGFQYAPVSRILFRAGFGSSSFMVYAGAGLVLKNFRLDITSSWHPRLGFTPSLALLSSGK